LPSFRSFCYGKQAFTFPSLTYFFAEACPQMEILSSGVAEAPCLTRIHVHEGWMRWKGDLNKTIEHAFMAQVHILLFSLRLTFLLNRPFVVLKTMKIHEFS
jgi:hypothetical protein